MHTWGWVLIGLGLLDVMLGLWSRRLRSHYWRSRLLVGLVVTLSGLYFLLK